MTSAARISNSGDPVVIAAIPVRNELEWTQPLVESLLCGLSETEGQVALLPSHGPSWLQLELEVHVLT